MDFSSLTNIVMFGILGLLILVAMAYIYKLEKSPNTTIYMIDLVTINGKLNERKFCRLGAWVVSTWGFIYLISLGRLDEWYFLGYIGTWVTNALIDKYIPNPQNNEPGGTAFRAQD